MSRRLGRNKALEPFEGEPLIRRVIGRMRQVAESVIVVGNDAARIEELSLPVGVVGVADERPGSGSLGGIYTGLRAARTEWAAFCACDMPFLAPALYELLLANREGVDAVVPLMDGRPEPIHAVYSRACLDAIHARILADDLKIAAFYDDVRVRMMPQERVLSVDPDLLSFFNVNTQADMDAALAIARRGGRR